METCYIDWSGRRGILVLSGETGLDYKIYASLDDLLDSFHSLLVSFWKLHSNHLT